MIAIALHLVNKESRGRIGHHFLRSSWDLVIFFVILVFGLAYTEDLSTGIKVLETSSTLIGMGIIGCNSILFDNRESNDLLKFLAVGILIASLICLAHATLAYFRVNDLAAFSSYRLTAIVNSHPTYFAYYLITAITYCLFEMYYNQVPFSKTVMVPILLILFLTLNLTGGNTAYFSVILVFSFFTLKSFVDPQSFSRKVVIVLVVIGLSTLFLFNLTGFNIANDRWERIELWKSAIDANPNRLLGVGTGDYKNVLNAYYLEHDMNDFAVESYNSHNQYIQIYFSNGILGLLALSLLIVRPLYLCFSHRSTLGILLIFPFLIYGITEVFLGRYQGVVFFAFLHQIFISSSLSRSMQSATIAFQSEGH